MAYRDQVYRAIDDERAYQDQKWGPAGHRHSLEQWVVYMEDYLAEAKHIMSREAAPACYVEPLNIMRKVAAMAVAAMEEHGAPMRETEIT